MPNRFLSAKIVINSLRDNGYSNTAYALGELVDNSLQAGASRVEIGVFEDLVEHSARSTYNVKEISVLDDGHGMPKDILRLAMQFGGSKNKDDAEGMGKFGMGLPNSSISQCKRVDVWSWTEKGDCYYTYLDVEKMKDGNLEDVPDPEICEIPERYRSVLFENGKSRSGTLVVWSDLDRMTWKTGASIYKHCESLVGRMYRNYIESGEKKIYCNTYRKVSKNSYERNSVNQFRANDPMYLIKDTSLPSLPGEYEGESFFELISEKDMKIKYEDALGEIICGTVTIRSSVVKKSVSQKILSQSTVKLGRTKWGKHCAKNVGVSIVRAKRELVLKDSFIPKDLREFKGRFMAVEVEFSPALDDLFGVLNNKQDAVKLIPYDIDSILKDSGFDTWAEYEKDLIDNNDAQLEVLKVVKEISSHVQDAKLALKSISIEPRTTQEVSTEIFDSAAGKATTGANYRDENVTRVEVEEGPATSEDVSQLLQDAANLSKEDADEKADSIISSNQKYYIDYAARDSEAFFEVSRKAGLTLVIFNTNHVFYDQLVCTLDKSQRQAFELAMAGFARVAQEEGTTSPKREAYLNSIRREWGIALTHFLIGASEEEEFDAFL